MSRIEIAWKKIQLRLVATITSPLVKWMAALESCLYVLCPECGNLTAIDDMAPIGIDGVAAVCTNCDIRESGDQG